MNFGGGTEDGAGGDEGVAADGDGDGGGGGFGVGGGGGGGGRGGESADEVAPDADVGLDDGAAA